MKLVLATANKGKVREIREIFADSDLELLSLEDFPAIEMPPETGDTFTENALIKARAVSLETGLPALADDSGLEVDALDGAPGVFSARYAGVDASDEDNNEKLLREMGGVPDIERSARYHAEIAVVCPGGPSDEGEERIEATFDGVMEGFIAREESGEGGFGYDPLFYLPDYGMTAAEISPEEKNRISHRGKALKKVAAWLKGIAKERV